MNLTYITITIQNANSIVAKGIHGALGLNQEGMSWVGLRFAEGAIRLFRKVDRLIHPAHGTKAK